MQRHNVTRWMAHDAARNATIANNRPTVIWYDNPRDGWHWDFADSECVGQRNPYDGRPQPKTEKIVKVRV